MLRREGACPDRPSPPEEFRQVDQARRGLQAPPVVSWGHRPTHLTEGEYGIRAVQRWSLAWRVLPNQETRVRPGASRRATGWPSPA